MPKTPAALAATLLLAGSVHAQTIDFESAQQNTIASLAAEHGFSFAGDTHAIETHKGDAFLRLGGEASTTPQATWRFDQPIERGRFTATLGATSSAADAYLRVMSGEHELFRLRIQSRDIIRVEGDDSRTFTTKTNEGLDTATLGTGTDYANRLVAEFAWDRSRTPAVFQYRLTQPHSSAAEPLATGWVSNLDFQSEGVPDRLILETRRHDHASRDLLVYDLQLESGAATERDEQ